MKNIIILFCFLFAGLPLTVCAQQEFVLKGSVMDVKKQTVPGVNIYVKNSPGMGVASDNDGNYQIKVKVADVVVFSFIGFRTKEILIDKEMKELNVIMEEDTEMLEQVEVVKVGYGAQRKVSVLAAISSVEVEELKRSSVTSLSNALSGRMAGIIGVQRSGEPGEDVSEFWIRGISTFGAKDKALILIDGIERESFNDLLPEDIESFSILKDATATAIYGARGANGVVLINTKRGKEGRMNISANVKTMVEYLPKLPNYLRAYDYAKMANEARLVRGEAPIYDPEMFDVIKYNLDPDMFPDVSWQDEILKRATWGLQANLNVSGGGSIARYFISASYRTNDAAYKQSGINKYNTNVKRHQYSFRSNVDVNVTKSTTVGVSLSTNVVQMNRPGIGSTSQIWAAQANLNPLMVPVRYSNGQLPAYGAGDGEASPSVLLNETGFVTNYNNRIESLLRIHQDLSMVTKGLSAGVSLSFDASNTHNNTRSKMPELYRAVAYNSKGNLITTRTVDSSPISFSTSSSGDRKVYLEAKVDYSRVFGAHRVSALVLYNQSSYNTSTASDEISSIPSRSQGLAGRLTYSYNDIYFVEGNFGYNGTENFPKGERFGFFPSLAVGWVPSNYQYVKDHWAFMTMLKLRYSFGAVGNDQISGSRFPFLTYVGSAPGYSFGDRGEHPKPGIVETRVGSVGLIWEKALKHNVGLDVTLWDRVSIEVDYFHDLRKGIFMERSQLPDIMGLPNTPYGNMGRMRNNGIDGTLAYQDKIGPVAFEVRGNFTITKNKIIDYDEPSYAYPYLANKGKSLNVTRGYIAMGLFRDSTEIVHSPKQLGEVRPGDIKYKDVNGDGVINEQDIVPIGNSNIPRIQYGFAASVEYKNWDVNVFFRGSGGVDFFYGGSGYFPFANGEVGNVLTVVNDPKNRWIPAWYSGDPSTENPDARFPRLSYGENKNNFVNSSHWLANGAYLRLKTVELGYTLPKEVAKKIRMTNFRVSVIADNLHVWDKVKLWDPEQASGNGAGYPLTRSFTMNIQMSF